MLLKDTVARYYKLMDFQRYLVNRYIMRKFSGGLTCYDDENAIAVPDDFRKSIKFNCDLCGGYPIQLLDASKGLSAGEATDEFVQVVLRAESIRNYEDFEEIIKRDVSSEVKEDAQKAIARTKLEEQAKAQAAVRARQAAEAVAATETQRRAEAQRAKAMFEQQARRAEQSRMQAEQYAVATDQARKKAEEREYWLHSAVQQALAETEHNFKQERARWKKERKALQHKAARVIAMASIALVLGAALFVLFVVVPNVSAAPKTINVNLNANGGTITGESFFSGEVGKGLLLPDRSRVHPPDTGRFSDGYRFGGWCLSSQGGNGNGEPVAWVTYPDLESTSVLLHAKWEPDPAGASVLGARPGKDISIYGTEILVKLPNTETSYNTTEDSLRADFEFSPNAKPVVCLNNPPASEEPAPAPESISLSPGLNVVYLKVTSGSGAVIKIYTMTIVQNTTVDLVFMNDPTGTGNFQKYIEAPVMNGELVPQSVRQQVTTTNEPVRAGYQFTGWTFHPVKAGESTATYNTMNFTTFRPQVNTVLYARFMPKTNRVVFNSNRDRYLPENPSFNVSGNMSTQFIDTDTAKNLTKNTFSVIGWRFMGWATENTRLNQDVNTAVVFRDEANFSWDLQSFNTNFGFNGTSLFGGSQVTLYAIWQRN